ncbi:MAG: binding-protein-dependent transport system inner rane component [Thermomicrobiales bacterium]|nr:binding-protein-dependent transport system inner rane component [Thermomicrobiales bacterium]
MTGYILRRLAYMVPVLFLITVFIFFLVRFVPGDPAAIMLGTRASEENMADLRAYLGLDEPYWVQYGIFMRNLARGDLGDSIRQRRPVTDILAERIPPTVFLVSYAALLSVLITAPLATMAALNRGRWIDQAVRVYALLALAMPAYWIGMMLLQVFAVKLQLFPVAGYGEGFLGHLESLFLPALSLALAVSSILIRSLRNSAMSTATILSVFLAFLIGGTTIVETIFAVPGIGQLIIKAIFDRDYPIIQGVTLAIGVMVLFINLITDISYAILDPRLSYS